MTQLCEACGGNGVIKLYSGTAQIGTSVCPACHGDGWAIRPAEPPPTVHERMGLSENIIVMPEADRDSVFFISPRKTLADGTLEPEAEWAKRCVVIKGLAPAEPPPADTEAPKS